MSEIEKIFHMVTGMHLDVLFENYCNSYVWNDMSEKKRRAKKKYLRRFYRNSSDKAERQSAVELSKEAVKNPFVFTV